MPFDDFDVQTQSEEYYGAEYDLDSINWDEYPDEFEEIPLLPLYELGWDNNFYEV